MTKRPVLWIRETTSSILTLLKELNKRLNLTIVIITHEMQVVKEICNKVAVMENGGVIEYGSILDIFTKLSKDHQSSTAPD